MVGSRVYVGGLPYGVRERDLERFFKGYGRTRDILIKNGYGFVVSGTSLISPGCFYSQVFLLRLRSELTKEILFQEFEDYRDADDAVYELNGKELLGER